MSGVYSHEVANRFGRSDEQPLMRSSKLVLGGVAAVAVAVTLLLGGALGERSHTDPLAVLAANAAWRRSNRRSHGS